MSISDNLVVKVQPASGDTYVKNLITVEDVAASGAGTLALVDDAGLFGWNVQGPRNGNFTGGIQYEGGAMTVAVRFKCASRTGDFSQLFAVSTAASGSVFGPRIANAGTSTGAIRLQEQLAGAGTTVIGSPAYTNGQYFTAVIRLHDTTFGPGTIAAFLKQTGRVSNDPDYSLAGSAASRLGVVDDMLLGGTSQNITFTDIAVWTRALTDAEAAAVADDIRGALDTNVYVSNDNTCTYGISAEVSSSLAVSYALISDGVVSSDLVVSYQALTSVSKDMVISYAIASATGSILSDIFINNTLNAPFTTETVFYTLLPNGRTGAITGITPTEGSKALVSGRFAMSGLALGNWKLEAAVRGATAAEDAEFVQHFLVS